MEFTTPLPFSEALQKLLERGVMPSALSSAEWREVEVAIRERAFLSSRVESARLLQAMKDYLGDFMAGARMENGGLKAQGRAEFVADMRALAIREGLGRVDEKTGKIDPVIRENDLRDIRSSRRLQLIFDTQTESAHEYGFWKQGQDPDILWVYPAQRFIRIRPVMIPRFYHQAEEGTIRRKDDLEFWLDMNRDFNVPWGPWGFASGMGVEDVDREEAVAAGVLRADEVVRPIEQTFNNGLSAGIRDLDGGLAAALARITGGTVAKGRVVAREVVAEVAPWPVAFKSMAEAGARWKDTLGVETILTQTPKGGPKWGAKFTSQKSLLEHLQVVGSEMARLVAEIPTLKGKLKTFMAVKHKRGMAYVNGPKPVMATKAKEWSDAEWKRREVHQESTGIQLGTERKGTQVRDNFRHELGHTLSTAAARAEFQTLALREGWDQAWRLRNLSKYATKNDNEAIAEAFGIFTREDYQAGTLPVPLENYLRNITI